VDDDGESDGSEASEQPRVGKGRPVHGLRSA
jgi:hypothetical protein